MNKITKLLSVFIIAGAIGTGIAGVAGCGGNGGGDNDDGGETTCQHTTVDYQDNHDGATHKVVCTDECKETIKASEEHTDADEDDVCDDCGGDIEQATVTVTIDNSVPGEVVAGESITLSATVTPSEGYTVEWEITTGGTLATISGNTLTAGNTAGDVIIKANVKDASGTVVKSSAPKTINVRAANIYDSLKASTDKIYNNEFETAADKLPDFEAFGTAGIYGYNATAEAHYTKVENGVAKLQKLADVDTNETVAIVDFGTDIKDIIEGYVEVTVQQETGGSWSFFRILKSGTTPDEIFSLRTTSSDGTIGYRYNKGANVNAEKKQGENDVKATVGTPLGIYFKYNKVTNKLNVTVNGTTIVDNTLDLSAAKGIGFYSSGSNKRTIWLDNLVICSSELTVSEYAEAVTGNVVAYNTAALALKAGENWASSATADAITGAKSTADTALSAATTKAQVDTAYGDYVDAVNSALSTEYFERLKAAYPATDYNTGEGSAYDTAIAAAQTAFNGVNTLEGFATTYAEQDTLLKAIPTAAAENLTKVVIEIYKVVDETETKIGTIDKDKEGALLVVGGVVTVDNIKAACTVGATEHVSKVYKEATKATEITANYTAAEEDGTVTTDEDGKKTSTVKLYVSLGERVSVNLGSLIKGDGIAYTDNATTPKTGTLDSTNATSAVRATAATNIITVTLADNITGQFSDNKLKGNGGAIKDADNNVIYEAGLATGGKTVDKDKGDGSQHAGDQSIAIAVDKACTIKVVFAADSGRNGAICKANNVNSFSKVEGDVLAFAATVSKTEVSEVSAKVTEAGTYYFCCDNNINIYEIIIEYDA